MCLCVCVRVDILHNLRKNSRKQQMVFVLNFISVWLKFPMKTLINHGTKVFPAMKGKNSCDQHKQEIEEDSYGQGCLLGEDRD